MHGCIQGGFRVQTYSLRITFIYFFHSSQVPLYFYIVVLKIMKIKKTMCIDLYIIHNIIL